MPTPYKFNGKEKDEETGLYYYGARYYTPEVSVWLSVDPMADKYPSMSPFMYCAGNPVRLVDPTGMIVEPTDDANVNNRINPNHKDYNKAFHEKYKQLDADQNTIFTFNKVPKSTGDDGKIHLGNISCNGRNLKGQDLISINYTFGATTLISKEGALLEETFHATQFLNGNFGFQSTNNGQWEMFAVDKFDEAEAQIFSAQNVAGVKSVVERALIKAFNNGNIVGVVNFLENRPGKQGYKDFDRGPISAEDMFWQYHPNYSSPLYNSNGTSKTPGIIMRKPN